MGCDVTRCRCNFLCRCDSWHWYDFIRWSRVLRKAWLFSRNGIRCRCNLWHCIGSCFHRGLCQGRQALADAGLDACEAFCGAQLLDGRCRLVSQRLGRGEITGSSKVESLLILLECRVEIGLELRLGVDQRIAGRRFIRAWSKLLGRCSFARRLIIGRCQLICRGDFWRQCGFACWSGVLRRHRLFARNPIRCRRHFRHCF